MAEAEAEVSDDERECEQLLAIERFPPRELLFGVLSQAVHSQIVGFQSPVPKYRCHI